MRDAYSMHYSGYGPAEDEMAWTTNWSEFITEYSDAKSAASYLKSKAPKMRQALLYASMAADKGFGCSRLLLACAYARGRLVTPDRVEAYKWMKLAQPTGAVAETVRSSLRQELLKTLSLAEVQAGELRAAQFRPGGTARQIRTALVVPKLKLAGLASSDGVFVAILNGTKLTAGSEAQLKIEGLPVLVRCLSVDAKEAVISLVPSTGKILIRPGQAAVFLH